MRQRFPAQELAVVGVAVDAVCAKAAAAVELHALTWPQLCDGKGLGGEVARLYNADVTPTYYVLDAGGRIVGKKIEAAKLEETVAKALAAGAGKS